MAQFRDVRRRRVKAFPSDNLTVLGTSHCVIVVRRAPESHRNVIGVPAIISVSLALVGAAIKAKTLSKSMFKMSSTPLSSKNIITVQHVLHTTIVKEHYYCSKCPPHHYRQRTLLLFNMSSTPLSSKNIITHNHTITLGGLGPHSLAATPSHSFFSVSTPPCPPSPDISAGNFWPNAPFAHKYNILLLLSSFVPLFALVVLVFLIN